MKFPDKEYTNRADLISERSIEKSIPVYNQLVDRLQRLTSAAESFGEAEWLLERYALDEEFFDRFSEILFDGMTTEDALGRSFVVEKDRVFSASLRKESAKFDVDGVLKHCRNTGWFACSDERIRVSFDITPERAAQYMREKAFWITGIENDALAKAIQTELERALRDGKTWAEFRSQIDKVFEQFRADRLAPHHLQTVFRTNLFSAYSVAQREQIEKMKDRFPLWRYVAIMDSATRPSHAALNNKIFKVGEGPYPPIDFNCRCTAQHLHEYQVQAERIKPSENVNMPDRVIDFTDESLWKKWIGGKRPDVKPVIQKHVQKKISQPPEPRPPERSATDLFDINISPKAKREILDGLKAVDEVHTIPLDMEHIPLRAEKKKRYWGAYYHTNNRPVRITIAPSGDHIGMTMVHEFGHFLDQRGIGIRGMFSSEGDPILDEWRGAVLNSQAVTAIRSVRATTKSYSRKEYLDYLLSLKELFARSYAQYIAKKSGNKKLLEELQSLRVQGGLEGDRQWSDEDFEPILRAFDRFFEQIGYRK